MKKQKINHPGMNQLEVANPEKAVSIENILFSSFEFTNELLSNEDLSDALAKGIKMIGNAIKVDQISYFKSHVNEESKKLYSSKKMEWTLKDDKTNFHNELFSGIVFKDLEEMTDRFKKKESFIYSRKDFDNGHMIKEHFQKQGIYSSLLIPVFITGKYQAYLAFNSYSEAKEWSALEQSLLKSFVQLYEKALEKQSLKEEVRESKENFYNFFNMTKGMLLVLNKKGEIIEINQNILKRLNYSKEELLNKNMCCFYSEKNHEELKRNFRRALAGKVVSSIDGLILTKEKEAIPVQTEFSKGLWNNEVAIFVVLKNTTALIRSEKKFSKAFNNGGLAKFISKFEDGEFIEVNDRFIKFLGYKRTELIGKNTTDFKMTDDYEDRDYFKKIIEQEGRVEDLEIDYIQKDGKHRIGLTNIVPFMVNNEKHLLSSIIDISKRVENKQELIRIAKRDPLTDLYNRRYFFEELEARIEEYKESQQVFSLAIIDIDDFKEINDDFGHLAGDYILNEFSNLLKENLKKNRLIARFGGEEFIVLFENEGKEESKRIMDQILKELVSKLFHYKNKKVSISFSAGIVSSNELEKEELSTNPLISKADQRMYRAKKSGKGKIIYKDLHEVDESI